MQRKRWDQFCIEYSETDYELLLNKIYGLSCLGILIFVILGLIAYYWRQIVKFCCCKNGLVFLVLHQNHGQNQPQFELDTVREETEKPLLTKKETSSALFLEVPRNDGIASRSENESSPVLFQAACCMSEYPCQDAYHQSRSQVQYGVSKIRGGEYAFLLYF